MPEWMKIAGATAILGVFGADIGLRTATAFSSSTALAVGGWIDRLLPEGKMDWTAIATIGLFVATFCLTGATIHLAKTARDELTDTRNDSRLAREEHKIERTVAVCVRYEADAMLVESVRRLHIQHSAAMESPHNFANDISLLLNYLDTIAIGLEEEIYEERRARKFMENILLSQCEQFLNERVLTAVGLELGYFTALSDLYTKWGATSDQQF